MKRARSHACLALLCIVAVSVCGQSQQTVPTGTVRGLVQLADTGKAAQGAIISLKPVPAPRPPTPDPKTGEFIVRDQPQSGQLSATVEPSGGFIIQAVQPGDYYVRTYLPGYLSQDDYISPGALSPEHSGDESSLPSFVQKIHVTPGDIVPVHLRLERGGSIEGAVRLSDGRPAHTGGSVIDEVALNVEIKTITGKFIRSGGTTHTDSHGHYRIDGLAPASYVVFAAMPGKLVPTRRGLERDTGELVYATNAIRASKARVISIRGTEVEGSVDIDVPVTGLHTISGKVVSPSGQAIEEGLVRLFPTGEPDLSRSEPIGIGGAFSFDSVSDEDYTITLEFPTHGEFLGMTEDKTGVRMKMSKAVFAPLSQTIRVAGQDPPPMLLRTAPAP